MLPAPKASTDVAIAATSLGFAYAGGRQILNGITFEVNQPGFCALIGPSGCGKSTLLQVLLGTPGTLAAGTLTGSVSIDGQNPSQAAQAGRLAFMSQRSSLFPNLTVRDNLLLPRIFKGEAPPEGWAELTKQAGLQDYLAMFPGQLSGGTRKRVELLRTFMTTPAVVMLDEPFSGQDLKHCQALYQMLLNFQQETRALVLFVTHDPLEAALLANRVLVLNANGKLMEDMRIAKPVPRVLDPQGPKIIEDEHIRLRSLILSHEGAA